MFSKHSATSYFFTALVLCSFPSFAWAINADEILTNINEQIPYLYAVVSGIMYVAGLAIFIRGIIKLRELGENNSMRQRGGLTEPLSHLIAGVALIYLPSTLDTMLISVYGTSNITAYTGYGPPGGTFNEMATVLISIVQFVGFIAFVRGIILFHRLGMGQAQQGTFNKGVTHLLGGVIAMNVVQFINIIGSTLGITL